MEYKELFAKKDHFGSFIGMEILEVRPGYAKTKLTLRPEHLNGLSTAHGGVVFTLADLAFAAAANTGASAVTSINNSISYVKPATSGDIFAEAKEITRGNKLVTYSVVVTNALGETLALFSGMGYVLNKNPYSQ